MRRGGGGGDFERESGKRLTEEKICMQHKQFYTAVRKKENKNVTKQKKYTAGHLRREKITCPPGFNKLNKKTSSGTLLLLKEFTRSLKINL